MEENPGFSVRLEGHTDNVGSEEKNMIISKNRAEAIGNFLLQEGIRSKRITVVYFGESKPIADNRTSAGKEMNRRVEIIVDRGE